VCRSAKAAASLSGDLNEEGIQSLFLPDFPDEFLPERVYVLPGNLSAGFEYPQEKFTLITYGSRGATASKAKRKGNKNAFNNLEELHRGDYIVHEKHGIGVFEGITKLEAGGTVKDYIKIKYDKGDILYIPVTQLDQVSKYIGANSETAHVKLNKLGGTDWQKTRSRVRSAVKDMAQELIELYSKRQQIKGFAFSPDIDMQNDFERRFEFEETADQLRCIEEIKSDMEKSFPMDRLLCGDVGFGKTEVALRGAFKCVADGKQCAILVPTTILALQHFQTIQKRFEGFPIESAMLSRFCSPSEISRTLKNIRRGSVDIVVGTHRLISKDIEFKDLGLIIVDEEQRFGVAQKEKLKELFPAVDVLTLTATPIPRTLNMAMSGIRDMSIIEEAPQDRYPVQTYVIEHNMDVLAQAMSSELRRGGQVYYLHNRIESIEKAAARVKEYMPNARVAIAHGRMSEDDLSDVWRSLLEGETDILVCTTIIETGIDVPNVNTLIIEDADKMGLAQLYQIRGRVGRSSRRASAYLTFTRGKQLTEIADRRLSAIREFTEFGSGFKIAMRDLELRGAGNILGAQQHGHMEAVGYDMYLKLLSQAISEEKGEKPEKPERECLIDLPIDAHIPEDYIVSVPHKLSMYRRIADIRTKEDADDVIDELIDRFGEPPQSVMGLVTVSLLRGTAVNQGVYEIGRSNDRLLLYIEDLNMAKITRLAQKMHGRITISAKGRPHISVKLFPGDEQLTVLNKVFDIMGADDI
jgi:transcription-repair coupling factor (superfamily II helicase)